MALMKFAAVAIVLAVAVTSSASAGAPSYLSVNRGSQWYWSVDLANAAFPTFKKLADGFVVSASACRGLGAPIPSEEVDVDLYHRFRCSLTGSTFGDLDRLSAQVAALKAEVVAARGTPQHDALLDRLKEAEMKRAQYEAHGSAATRAVALVVVGRRSFTYR
jgi:hypothetical protein